MTEQVETLKLERSADPSGEGIAHADSAEKVVKLQGRVVKHAGPVLGGEAVGGRDRGPRSFKLSVHHPSWASMHVELQEREFASEDRGYTAAKHQREVGTGYFYLVSTALNPNASTLALVGSTEEGQFH